MFNVGPILEASDLRCLLVLLVDGSNLLFANLCVLDKWKQVGRCWSTVFNDDCRLLWLKLLLLLLLLLLP